MCIRDRSIFSSLTSPLASVGSLAGFMFVLNRTSSCSTEPSFGASIVVEPAFAVAFFGAKKKSPSLIARVAPALPPPAAAVSFSFSVVVVVPLSPPQPAAKIAAIVKSARGANSLCIGIFISTSDRQGGGWPVGPLGAGVWTFQSIHIRQARSSAIDRNGHPGIARVCCSIRFKRPRPNRAFVPRQMPMITCGHECVTAVTLPWPEPRHGSALAHKTHIFQTHLSHSHPLDRPGPPGRRDRHARWQRGRAGAGRPRRRPAGRNRLADRAGRAFPPRDPHPYAAHPRRPPRPDRQAAPRTPRSFRHPTRRRLASHPRRDRRLRVRRRPGGRLLGRKL